MAVPVKSSTDRMMARVAIIFFILGASYGLYALSGPLYWRFYATVIKPFESDGADIEDDPFAAAVLHNLAHKDVAKEMSKVDKASPEYKKMVAEAIAKAKANGVKQVPKLVPKAEPKAEPVKEKPKTDTGSRVQAGSLHGAAKMEPRTQPVFTPETYNPDNYPLTKERVQKLATPEGYLMITWANHHYLDFAKSWVYHVKKVGLSAYIVGAMDDDMLRSLAEDHVETWRMDTGITKGDLGWGSPNFHKMGRFKISLIKQFLELDVVVIISDIDTTWLRDPVPYFKRYPEADVLTSTDELRETVPDESLEDNRHAGASFNIGIMMFRKSSMALVDEWIKSLDDPKMWDQTAFNQIARRGQTFGSKETKNLWKGFDGKLNIGILPASVFSSGHIFFVQTKYKELGLQPYVAHATFQYSGTPGKRNRFREFMLWDDPPEYYDSEKGFVAMSIDIPKDLWEAASRQVHGSQTPDKLDVHYQLVHYQLGLLRGALFIATLTDRVLVMPPIWCQLDKYWAPLHNGNIPGSKFIKPFICPMDHVLDIEAGWYHPKDTNHMGPNIQWREYSFLQNERMDPRVNNSRLELEVCDAGCDGSAIKDGKLKVPKDITAAKLKAVLTTVGAATDKTKILHLSTPALKVFKDTFKTFEQVDKDRFMVRLNHQVSVDCCLQQNPGWVWYDFFADLPHKDRFGREQNGKVYTYYAGDSQKVIGNVTNYIEGVTRFPGIPPLGEGGRKMLSAAEVAKEYVAARNLLVNGYMDEQAVMMQDAEDILTRPAGLTMEGAMLSLP